MDKAEKHLRQYISENDNETAVQIGRYMEGYRQIVAASADNLAVRFSQIEFDDMVTKLKSKEELIERVILRERKIKNRTVRDLKKEISNLTDRIDNYSEELILSKKALKKVKGAMASVLVNN